MKASYDLVVVIPVGPGTRLDFLQDTLDSFLYYTRCTYKIVIMDDSGQGLGAAISGMYPDLDLICNRRPSGTMGGLYISLSKVFSYVLDHYDCRLIMKLDTDALIIGPAPESAAFDLFDKDPLMAVAGQYPGDYDGKPWDYGWPRERIINGTMTWKAIKRPLGNIVLRRLYIRALRNGYLTGESVFGGATYYGHGFMSRLQGEGLLPDNNLSSMNLGEDHLYSLLAKTVGMNLGDLSSGNLPFACAWKTLPASPEQLYKEGRKIIHSTRRWQERDEENIRGFFKKTRI